jgi:hypothetical protein
MRRKGAGGIHMVFRNAGLILVVAFALTAGPTLPAVSQSAPDAKSFRRPPLHRLMTVSG